MSDASAAGRPLHRPIDSRLAFHAALHEAFGAMAAAGCREAFLVDEDFADWPLGERAVVDALVQWAGPQRRLVVVARRFDEVVRRHPRWVDWRRTWSHVVECRAFEDTPSAALPGLLLAAGCVAVHLADPLRHRGVLSRDPADLLQRREEVDALLQRTVDSFASTLLGL